VTLYADRSLPLWPVVWPVGPSSFTAPICRRVTSSLARRLARHLLVRLLSCGLWTAGHASLETPAPPPPPHRCPIWWQGHGVGPYEVGDWASTTGDRVGRSFCFINQFLWYYMLLLWRPALSWLSDLPLCPSNSAHRDNRRMSRRQNMTAVVFQTHAEKIAGNNCWHCYRLHYPRRPAQYIIGVKPTGSEAMWRPVSLLSGMTRPGPGNERSLISDCDAFCPGGVLNRDQLYEHQQKTSTNIYNNGKQCMRSP